jgi:transcriptional regulator with XRE-family HTH domain
VEQVGALLWEIRTSGGWSLGKLARQAGVSKSALSQWETGARQPRITELEAVLDALNATTLQRTLVFSRVEAPRAIRHLTRKASENRLGPPPTVGDMLRALRLRQGWTQAQLAHRLGVNDSSIARWERSERFPSTEQMQALCYALEAQEEEIVALTTRAFSEAPASRSKNWEEVQSDLRARTYAMAHFAEGLEELRYLLLEREAWEWAAQKEEARVELAHICAYHATFFYNHERWQEAASRAQRAMILLAHSSLSEDYIRACLVQAAAAVYGGSQVVPQRGVQQLKPLMEATLFPAYHAWVLGDLAKYFALSGQTDAGLSLSAQARQVAGMAVNRTEHYLRTVDHASILIQAGRAKEALQILPDPANPASRASQATVRLLLAEAHLQIGSLSEGQDWLQQAQTVIETHQLTYLRPKAEALAQQF